MRETNQLWRVKIVSRCLKLRLDRWSRRMTRTIYKLTTIHQNPIQSQQYVMFARSIFWNSMSFDKRIHRSPTKRGPNGRKRISTREQSVPVVSLAGGERAAVHAPLAETFRKFEERLERSGRGTKRADTTGPRLPAEVIVFLAARERTYSASKYTPRGWLAYVQCSHGTENKHYGPRVCYQLFQLPVSWTWSVETSAPIRIIGPQCRDYIGWKNVCGLHLFSSVRNGPIYHFETEMKLEPCPSFALTACAG